MTVAMDDAVARADALLEAIYESAVDPSTWLSLHHHMLKNFRYDEEPTAQQKSFLNFVVGHVHRALKIAETRERLQWERQQLAQCIDAIAPALCIIRSDRTIVGINPAAERILQARVHMQLGGSFLAGEERGKFERAIEDARCEGHGTAVFRSSDSGEELLLYVAPLGSESSGLLAVVLFKKDEALRNAIEQYADLFNLTEKERRVVAQAIRCTRLEGVAAAEDIGYHTARQHLKAVYAKTGVSSQAELVAGVLRQTVVQEAARTQNAALLPHIRGLAHSHFIRVGSAERPRQLCYAEYGDPSGIPVLYFHSLTGSRLELFIHDDLLRSHGIRLLAVDRPGFGHSDFHEYRTYDEYTRDMRRLLDAAGLETVGLLSCSAGTPHALACAANLDGRISQIHCTGSIAPFNHARATSSRALLHKVYGNLFRIAPALVRPVLELMLRGQTVESLYRNMLERPATIVRSSPLDGEFISQPEHIDYFIASTIESLRQGTKAWAKEGSMLNQDWGIPFQRTRCAVHFWHGDEDDLAPRDMIESFAAEFPKSHLHVLRAETHLLIFRHLGEILPAFHAASAGTVLDGNGRQLAIS